MQHKIMHIFSQDVDDVLHLRLGFLTKEHFEEEICIAKETCAITWSGGKGLK